MGALHRVLHRHVPNNRWSDNPPSRPKY